MKYTLPLRHLAFLLGFLSFSLSLLTATAAVAADTDANPHAQQQQQQQQQVITGVPQDSINIDHANPPKDDALRQRQTNGAVHSTQDMFDWLDLNHDHKLTLSDFIKMDTDGNEQISVEEFHGALLRGGAVRGGDSWVTTPSSPTQGKKYFSWGGGGGSGIAGGVGSGGFIQGFTSSTAMIIATEIGDKTFFIAAVLSMRHSRFHVFAGAILALICMTILSTMMGLILPSLLPRQYTHIIGGILFLYFGIKLIYDSRSMSDKVSDELEEVEEELGCNTKKNDLALQDDYHDDNHDNDKENISSHKKHQNPKNFIDTHDYDTDEENRSNSILDKPKIKSSTRSTHPTRSTHHPSSMMLQRRNVFFQAFLLTFLAEWGDRSQIATIALAAAKDPYGVTFGACFGHCLCTGLAVVGGRMLASKISEKTVSFWGGIIFLCFGVHALIFDV